MTKRNTERTERDEDTRDLGLRPVHNFEYVSPYDLPAGVYREGYRYHWGRHTVRGINDHRIEKLRRKYWELVPASRTTDKFLDPLGDNPLSEKFICTNGYILLERPEQYSTYEEQQQYNDTIEITNALKVDISDEGVLPGSRGSRRYS
jgi:hypothetical protein